MVVNNPFAELYVTENIGTDTFARLFSPVLAHQSETHALFQHGNIVLTGLQGSGKTALLNLMRPEVMIAYRKIGSGWPIPKEMSRFISAGINLNSSRARDFGQRILPHERDSVATDALLFGDFLNYWIVDNLLTNMETIRDDVATELFRDLGVDARPTQLDQFAKKVASERCWFGSLHGVQTYRQLRAAIEERIFAYRQFLNYNAELPISILQSKTSAGEPIGVVATALKEARVLSEDVPILVVIDQFEDLMGLEVDEEERVGTAMRGVVMKMLSERGQRVSYRLGARPYSLYPDFAAFRAGSPAEEMRNFRIIDLGALLRSREAGPGLFKEFCEDVFRRRLTVEETRKGSLLGAVFGRRASPEDKARRYVKSNRGNVVGAREGLPEDCASILKEIAMVDPLSARLGVAWVLQQRERKDTDLSVAQLERQPWNHGSRRWWKKERSQHALLQIAAGQQQKMMWYGPKDIVALCGGNILIFLSICQFIWAEYLRSLTPERANPAPSIGETTQDIGIHEASAYWFRKIKADPNGGDDRHRFVNVLGTLLRTGLREDRRMSYPGETGFSLSESELEDNSDVCVFLDRCVAYGVLESFRHTPKNKHRGQSRKWYLFPILTPYFQVPTSRTKEPKYLRVTKVRELLSSASVRHEAWFNDRRPKTASEGQRDLFSDDS